MDLGKIKITAININNERNKYNLTATNNLKKKTITFTALYILEYNTNNLWLVKKSRIKTFFPPFIVAL